MNKHIQLAIFVLFIASLVSGCVTTAMRTVALGDGRTINHPFHGSAPLPATNAIVRIEYAGYSIGPGKTDSRAHLLWAFMISEKGVALKAVQIRDVSGSPRVLEIDTVKHDNATTAHRWIGMTKWLPVTEQTEPWLFQRGDTTKVFEFTMETADGARFLLYQPVCFPNNMKVDHVYRVMMLNEVSRIKVRNPDAKVLMVK